MINLQLDTHQHIWTKQVNKWINYLKTSKSIKVSKGPCYYKAAQLPHDGNINLLWKGDLCHKTMR